MHSFWIYWFSDNASIMSDKLHQFIQSCPLHFFILEITERITIEIKYHTTLLQLL